MVINLKLNEPGSICSLVNGTNVFRKKLSIAALTLVERIADVKRFCMFDTSGVV